MAGLTRKCAVNLDEVVSEVVQRYGSAVVFNLATEAIRQASVAPHIRPHSPVLTFYETS